MTTYAIADLHLGSTELVKKERTQFANVDVHDNTIVNNILSTCGRHDMLYIVGDVVEVRRRLPLLKRICQGVGRVNVVLGNHDSSPKVRSDRPNTRELLDCGVHELFGMTSYRHASLTHAPMHPNICNEKNGWLNVHGHLHGNITFGEQYLNVSCNALDFRPINLDDWIEDHQ